MIEWALACVGFEPVGVEVGTLAAICQASYGNIISGSWFATCQSLAMGGGPVGIAASVACFGAAAACGITAR